MPDASIAINIAGSFTYYYTAPDAGTYFWHCHITPPEHLEMGMVGQLYVRPRQNRLTSARLRDALSRPTRRPPVNPAATGFDCSDILCTGQTPAPPCQHHQGGRASTPTTTATARPVTTSSIPIQMMGFDPNFHYVSMTFNPEAFADMKDKYFLLNGRSYPGHRQSRPDLDALRRRRLPPVAAAAEPDQINKSARQTRALLRISDLSVTEYTTLGTIGIPMRVIACNARLLRDMAGNNLYYNTNSITLGGGESLT